MKFNATKIKGLYLIMPDEHMDERGLFFRTFCKKEFLKVNIDVDFVQINQSINFKKGTFRGLHFQNPPFGDNKLIRCISGKVIDILVDLRKNSSTFLQYFMVEISEFNRKMVYVPEGIAHGFITLEDNSQLIYHHTSFYEPNHEGAVNYREPKIKINLPIPVSIISEKDLNIPFLNDTFNGL